MMTMCRYLGVTEEEFLAGEKPPTLDKKLMVRQYMQYMLDRTTEMFEYDGLPDTIPATALERMLQTIGYVVIAKVGDCIPRGLGPDFLTDNVSTDYPFALYGTFGEAPDPYMCPRTVVVSNPGFNPPLSRQYTINKDCIIIRNDLEYLGLLPLHRRYAWELTEGTISLRSAMINLREQTVIVAKSDSAYESALEYLRQKEAGELGVIMDKPLLGDSQVFDSTGRANGVIQLIEGIQYLKASWFNELGLNQAFNMKREYLSSEEIAANNDILLPLVDNMLRCREDAIKRVNEMFGLDISVKKNSAWENKQLEKDLGLEILAGETLKEGDGNVVSDKSEAD